MSGGAYESRIYIASVHGSGRSFEFEFSVRSFELQSDGSK